MFTNYRNAIASIADRHALAGENFDEALFAGCPDVIDAAEARRLAEWLDNSADSVWGPDSRHQRIASEIRQAVGSE